MKQYYAPQRLLRLLSTVALVLPASVSLAADISLLSSDPALAASQIERCDLWSSIRDAEMPTLSALDKKSWNTVSNILCHRKGYFTLYSDFKADKDIPSCMIEAGCTTASVAPSGAMTDKEKCRLYLKLRYTQLLPKAGGTELEAWKAASLKNCDAGTPSFQSFRDYEAARYKPVCQDCQLIASQKFGYYHPNTVAYAIPNGGGGGGNGFSGGGFSSPCKRGIALDVKSVDSLRQLSQSVSWWYNWSNQPSVQSLPADIKMEYIPMIWSKASLGASMPQSSTVLGFNEPNFFVQANMSPADAAGSWPQVQQRAAQNNAKVASPAVNYCGGGCWDENPISYLDKFFAACPNCNVDYIAIHSYTSKSEYFRKYVELFKKYNKPIWVTEFACYHFDNGGSSPCSLAEQKAFMQETVSYLEQEPSVAKYAWFSDPNIPNSAVLTSDQTGSLTELGSLYVGMPSNCPR